VQKLLKELPPEQKKLVDDLIPAVVNATTVQRVLQALLRERVSIRDLPAILEGIAEAVGFTRNPRNIAEHVRSRLSRQLCAQNVGANNTLPILTLSPRWETSFAESIVGTGDDRHLAMQPSKLTEFVHAIRDGFEDAARAGEVPVLVTSAGIRPFVRGIIERFRAQTTVMSQAEIHPRARLRTVGSI